MILSLKQIQEKCIEQNRPLYMVFVDFTMAFDTVHRETLWKLLRKIGCPDLFIDFIASLHKDMKASVSLKGGLSKLFDVQNRVKQGCVLAPTLFSLFLSKVLDCAFAGCNKGVTIQSRLGANLFNASQFKSTTRTKPMLVRKLMFADDTAFVAHSHEDMQEIIIRFANAANFFGLQVNIKKREMMFQPSPGTDDHHRCIQISGEDMVTVKEFKYLDSTATYNNKLDTELRLQKSKASQAFGRLKDRVWFNKDLAVKTKCAVYSATVLSTQLYGAESWTVYMAQAHSLNAYMMRHMRQILDVKWWHRIPNQDILMQTNMSRMYETLIHCNLRCAGHLIRFDNTRLPKQIIYSQLKEGHRSVGRPKVRFKDTIKRNLERKGIPAGTKKLTTNHSGENLYEGCRHRIRWIASSSSSSSSSM